MEEKLKELRKKIDNIDNKILKYLNKRALIAKQIAKIKLQGKKNIFSPEREHIIISNLIKNNKGPLTNKDIKNIFTEILHSCRGLQRKIKVAYLGPEITFTHLAAMKLFGSSAEYIPAKSIADVFEEVEKGYAEYGVVPIENSQEGVITYTLDMFVESNLKICAEIYTTVTHALISKGNDISKIKYVYSHPQALAQCRNWLEKHLPHAKKIETSSTAEAAMRILHQKHNKSIAAIAAVEAAKYYNLNILAEKIEDTRDNITRFLVIGHDFPQPSGNDKTSIMFSVRDRVGALHDSLVPFKKHHINLTKIESRPSKRKPWEYIFFADFTGHVSKQNVKRALAELKEQCLTLKILGSYPKAL